MSITNQVSQILNRHQLKEAPKLEPELSLEPSEEVENDPFDNVECPQCGCNAWDTNGPEKVREIRRRKHGIQIKVLRRIVFLKCGNQTCGHRWKMTILEEK